MDAIAKADEPIYCDTDSLICRNLSNVPMDAVQLGAWDKEAEFDDVIIVGKKLYGCKVKGKEDGQKGRDKIRSKGVSGVTWADLEKLLDGQIIEKINNGVTMTKRGDQFYMRRQIRATALRRNSHRRLAA